jgi:hypothetical protein
MVRDLAPADLRAVRTAIGGSCEGSILMCLREEIPGRMAELLRRLDQLTEASPRDQDTDEP